MTTLVRADPSRSVGILAHVPLSPEIDRLNSVFAARCPDWQPETWHHLTLVIVEGLEVEALTGLLPDQLAFSVLVTGISSFDTPDGYAVHLTVRLQGELATLQTSIAKAVEAAGGVLGEFSAPDIYKPHITLGYTSEPVEDVTFEVPLALPVSVVDVSAREGSAATIMMRSALSTSAAELVINPFRTAPLAATLTAKGEIEGYIFIFGSADQRDEYGTWVDRSRPPEIGADYVPFPVYYEHAQDGVLRKAQVGRVEEIWIDDQGFRFRGCLDTAGEYFNRILKELRSKELKTSSATAPHLAEFDNEGRFVHWQLVELSLTKNPGERRMPAVELIRSGGHGRDARSREDARSTHTKPSSQGGRKLMSITLKGKQKGGKARNGANTSPTADQSTRALADMLTPEALAEFEPQALVEALVEEYGLDAVAQMFEQMVPADDVDRAEDIDEEDTPRNDEFAEEDEPRSRPKTKARRSTPVLARTAGSSSSTQPNGLFQAMRERLELMQLRGEVDSLREQVNGQRSAPPPTQPFQRQGTGTANSGGNARVSVGEELKFARHSPEALAFAHELLKSFGVTPSEALRRTIAARAAGLAEKGTLDPFTATSIRSATGLNSIRANELMASTIATQGAEWVGVFYSGTIWEKARYRRVYQEMLRRGMMQIQLGDGEESGWIPLEDADPVFYTASQATDVDSTLRPEIPVAPTVAKTARVQVTPGELRATIYYTDILSEDAVINVATQLSNQMQEAAEDTIEYVIINGDTTATANTNINLIDGTPNATTTMPSYLVTNGILKLPLVTNTAMSRDAAGLSEQDYLSTVALLPPELWSDIDNVFFLTDPTTYQWTLPLGGMKTRDVNSQSTLESGVFSRIWGYDVLASGRMGQANAAGKISATPANNVFGRIASVYPKYWAFINKRRITIETGRYIESGVNVIVASMRLGVRRRSDNAAALSYGVTNI